MSVSATKNGVSCCLTYSTLSYEWQIHQQSAVSSQSFLDVYGLSTNMATISKIAQKNELNIVNVAPQHVNRCKLVRFNLFDYNFSPPSVLNLVCY